jgi:hypothetical protein
MDLAQTDFRERHAVDIGPDQLQASQDRSVHHDRGVLHEMPTGKQLELRQWRTAQKVILQLVYDRMAATLSSSYSSDEVEATTGVIALCVSVAVIGVGKDIILNDKAG